MAEFLGAFILFLIVFGIFLPVVFVIVGVASHSEKSAWKYVVLPYIGICFLLALLTTQS